MWLVQNVLLDESFKRKFNGIIIILSKAYRLISAKQTSRVGLPKNIFELLTNFKSWECFTDTIQPLKNGPKQNPFFSSKSTLQTTTTSTAKWSDSLPIILKLFFSNKKSIVFNSILIHLVFIIVLTLACCFAATWTTTTKTTTIATTTTTWLWWLDYLLIFGHCNNENLPNGIKWWPKTGSKFYPILKRPSHNHLRLLKYCQNGEISPNLVTLPSTLHFILRWYSLLQSNT